MSLIIGKMRDGTIRRFEHQSSAKGVFTNHVAYAPGVVVIIDMVGNKTAFPLDLVQEVDERLSLQPGEFRVVEPTAKPD